MNPILFGKPIGLMKRKRPILHQSVELNENGESEEEEEEEDMLEYNNEDDSNSSLASSNSSTGSSSLLKAQRIKHGHKMIITEERMSTAMQDLKLELNNLVTNVDEAPPVQDDVVVEEEEEEEEEGGIMMSEELKQRLRQYKMEDMLLNSHFKSSQQQEAASINPDMQLVVWTPWTPSIHHFAHSISHDSSSSSSDDGDSSDTSSSSSSSTSSCYKVQDPLDIYKQNRLKRKFSQMNKILIEEVVNKLPVRSDDNTAAIPNTQSVCNNFYLVDDSELATGSKSSSATCNNPDSQQINNLSSSSSSSSPSGFKIVEIPTGEEVDMDEQMEF